MNGFFGTRMADMAKRCGANVIVVEAEWGCIIVMDPRSGEVLGASTAPMFDPNEYVHGQHGPEANVLVHNAVEPGSTAKPLLAAYAIVGPAPTAVGRWLFAPELRDAAYALQENTEALRLAALWTASSALLYLCGLLIGVAAILDGVSHA